jgi:hypothetical protein
MQRSSVGPSRRRWIVTLAINILPFTPKVKQRLCPAQRSTSLELEVIFCVYSVRRPLLSTRGLPQAGCRRTLAQWRIQNPRDNRHPTDLKPTVALWANDRSTLEGSLRQPRRTDQIGEGRRFKLWVITRRRSAADHPGWARCGCDQAVRRRCHRLGQPASLRLPPGPPAPGPCPWNG